MFLTKSSWSTICSANQSKSPVESIPVERIVLNDSTAGIKPRLFVSVLVEFGFQEKLFPTQCSKDGLSVVIDYLI